MTLSKSTLAQWEESMGVRLSKAQRITILQRFGSEPEPYERSEQDIAEQIRTYLQWNAFEKPMSTCNGKTTIPIGVDF